MRVTKLTVLAGLLLSLLAVGVWLITHKYALIRQNQIFTDKYGAVSVAYRLLGNRQQVMVFVDTKKFQPKGLAEQIAQIGAKAIVLDAERVFRAIFSGQTSCLDPQQARDSIDTLVKEMSLSDDKPVIVSGIGDGALLPFLQAEAASAPNRTNVSIDFSVALPAEVTLCPSFQTSQENQLRTLLSSPGLKDNWHAAWSDQPPQDTALFVRGLPETKIWIAPYDTPSDTVLIQELQKLIHPKDSSSTPMAVVEVPAAVANETVTLFYSGDGGWRDLDRIVAGEMAKQGYPVVGIDTLRSFWSRKTPEQATDELARTMAYYRKTWGAKSFVLTGYSFGADIIPSMYNRLTQADQESVRLLVFLTLSRQADFEIEVSGWLGKNSGQLSLAPELALLPKNKILCIYGEEEKDETACVDIANTQADLLELPGGHHFDEDYPKLTRLILERYQKVGIPSGSPH